MDKKLTVAVLLLMLSLFLCACESKEEKLAREVDKIKSDYYSKQAEIQRNIDILTNGR